MRPIYETRDDRAREEAVFGHLRDMWGVRIVKTPPLCPVDAAAETRDGKLLAFVEVKCRTMRYGDLMISAHKVDDLKAAGLRANVPSLLVVQWGSATPYYTDVRNPDGIRTGIGGRQDRGDKMDMETCCFIPIGRFIPCTMNPFRKSHDPSRS